MAPAYKRQQHDSISEAIAETEAELAQVDPLDVHSDLARQEQERLYNDLMAQSERLNAEGFNSRTKGDFLKTYKDYQQTVGPMGTIGKINAAKIAFNKVKEDFYKDGFTKGHSKMVLDNNWEKEKGKYTGFDEQGNISNMDPVGASLMFDVQKDVFDAASKLGETKGVNINNVEVKTVQTPNGEELVYLDKQTGERLDNSDQIAALTRGLISDYTNPNTSRGQFSEFTGLTKQGLADMLNEYIGAIATDKQTISRTATPLNNPYTENDEENDDEGPTSAITTGQRYLAKDARDLYTKISQLEAKKEELLNSSAPGAKAEYDQVVKNERKLNRLKLQAEESIKNDKKLNDLDNERVKANLEFEELETEVQAQIAELENNGEAEAARHLRDRLNDARNGYDVTEVADFSKLVGGEVYTKLNYMSSLKSADNRYKNYKNKLITSYVQRHGEEEVEFVSSSKDSEDKVLFNNLTKILRDVDFNVKYIEGLEGYDGKDFSSPRYDGVRNQIKDLIATSTDQVINFGTDGNTPFLSVTATPKSGTKIDTKIGDGIGDVNFDGGNRFTAKIPLIRYNNRNIPELTSFAIHLLNNSKLDSKTKKALKKSIYTSGISTTSDKNKLGESLIGFNYLGGKSSELINEGYVGIDFYQPLQNNTPMQAYKINEDGSKSRLTLNEIVPNSIEARNKFLNNSGVTSLYVDYAKNTTVTDMLSQFQDVFTKEEIRQMQRYNGSETIASIFGGLNDDSSEEDNNNFVEFMFKLPVMMKDVSGLIDISNSIQ